MGTLAKSSPQYVLKAMKRLFIHNEKEDVRIQALKLLMSLGRPVSNEFFAIALKDPNVHVRENVVDAWNYPLEDIVDLELFMKAFEDPDWQVRRAVLHGLERMPGELRPQLVDSALRLLKDPHYLVIKGALETLGTIGNSSVTPYVYEFMKSDTVPLQCAALNVLRRIGSERDVEMIIPALEDPDSSVQDMAERALKAIGGERANEALTALKQRQFAESISVKCICVLPKRFISGMPLEKIRNVLQTCAMFAGSKVSEKFRVPREQRDVWCIPTDPELGAVVIYVWKVHVNAKDQIAKATLEEWQALIAEVDRHGVDALLRAGRG